MDKFLIFVLLTLISFSSVCAVANLEHNCNLSSTGLAAAVPSLCLLLSDIHQLQSKLNSKLNSTSRSKRQVVKSDRSAEIQAEVASVNRKLLDLIKTIETTLLSQNEVGLFAQNINLIITKTSNLTTSINSLRNETDQRFTSEIEKLSSHMRKVNVEVLSLDKNLPALISVMENGNKKRIIAAVADENARIAAAELQQLPNTKNLLPSIISSIYASSIGNFRRLLLFVFEIQPASLQAIGYDALLTALKNSGRTEGDVSEILSFAVFLKRSIDKADDNLDLKAVQEKLPLNSVRKIAEGRTVKLNSRQSGCWLIGDKYSRVYNYETISYKEEPDYLSGEWNFETELHGDLSPDWKWSSFRIKNNLNGQYLEANENDGTYAYLRSYSSSSSQLWQVYVHNKDHIKIMNRQTSLYIVDENYEKYCNKWTYVKPKMDDNAKQALWGVN